MSDHLNPDIFREYDIRGLADVDLTDEKVKWLGRALGTYFRSQETTHVLVGRDVRLSSTRILKALTNGLLASGINITNLGVVPTPVFYFGLFHQNIPAGVMITASHNPKEFNGFKVAVDKTTIYGAAIQKLRAIAEKGDFVAGPPAQMDQSNLIIPYVGVLAEKVKLKRKLKVAFDPGNGTVGPVIDKLCKAIGIEAVIINLEPDGNFPNHLPDPTVPEYMEELAGVVLSEKLDLGIGFDGDGDRIGVIDEKGKMIWGDTLLAILAKKVLKARPGAKVVFEVKCSEGLSEFIKANGGVPLMYKTGHSLIKAKMKEEQAPIAGEMSGHIFIADNYYGYDDALFAALRLLELLSESSRPLSRLAAEVPTYCSTPEIRVPCPDGEKFAVTRRLRDHFAGRYPVIDIDGVRVKFADGWGLVRASNTQPVLVMRFEAKTEKRLREIRQEFDSALKQYSTGGACRL